MQEAQLKNFSSKLNKKIFSQIFFIYVIKISMKSAFVNIKKKLNFWFVYNLWFRVADLVQIRKKKAKLLLHMLAKLLSIHKFYYQ